MNRPGDIACDERSGAGSRRRTGPAVAVAAPLPLRGGNVGAMSAPARTVAVNNDCHRPVSPGRLRIAGWTALALVLASPVLRADVFTNVAEAQAEGYVLVYDINIPDDAAFRDATAVAYAVDNSGAVGLYDRIAYYLEMDDGSGLQWAYASMDAFDADPARIGLPHNIDNPVVRQQGAANLNVFSNKAGVANGTGLAGGLEMWPSGYTMTNDAGVPGASDATYDFGDGGASAAAGYGSFQVHNWTAGETVLAWNRWGVSGAADDVGIGNRATGNPDHTYAGNAAGLTTRRLQVLVRPVVPIPAPAAITDKVAEAAGYQLVYQLEIGARNDFGGGAAYAVDNRVAHPPGSFGRVAYFLELDSEWVWVSMGAFTGDAGLLGVPVSAAHTRQRVVVDMNVSGSAGSGVAPATGLQSGCIEFWPTDYDPGLSPRISGGSGVLRDFNDTPLASGAYGSMQVHDAGSGQTIFAFNNWNDDGVDSDLGLGTRGAGEPDWTGAANADDFTVRRLYVLVEPRGDTTSLAAFPANRQLFPRSLATGLGTLGVTGSESSGGFAEAVLRVFREGVQHGGEHAQALVYNGGAAGFAFNQSIAAELAGYGCELSLRDAAGRESVVAWAADLVAGDAFIIQGQSNATAPLHNGSSSDYINPYVRTFGLNTDNSAGTTGDSEWRIAYGDASKDYPGGVGQWGLVMGAELVAAHGVPVAVVNGATGGKLISYFQRNDNNPGHLGTNYGRLLNRMQRAGLAGAVRGLVWYQGEGDWNQPAVHESGWIALRQDWKQNYPAIERFYVLQVRECNCLVPRFDVDLRNRQRKLADRFTDVSVMSTNGLDGHDGCHYAFAGGYEMMGWNISRMIGRDLYGAPPTAGTDAPNPAVVELLGPAHDVIRIVPRVAGDALSFDPGAEADFAVVGADVAVVGGAIVNGAIHLQLSGSARAATQLMYTGHSGPAGPGPWVANENGIGLLSFSEPVVVRGPLIALTEPSGDPSFEVGSPVPIAATVTPNGSPVEWIEVLVDDVVVASVAGSNQVSTTWVAGAPGTCLVTVRATDEAGGVCEQSVSLFVGQAEAPGGVIDGLQTWLRPGIGVVCDADCSVASWADQSGNGHHVSQSNAAARPALVQREFGADPGLRFDGSDFLQADAGFPTGSYTKIVRYKLASVGRDNQLLSAGVSVAGAHALTHYLNDRPGIYHEGLVAESSGGVGLAQTAVVAATYDSGTRQGRVFLNGVATGSGIATGDNVTPTFEVGGYAGLFFLDGSVHEVLVYDRVLEDAEVVAVTRYLGDRYPPVLGLLGPAVLKHKRGDAFIDPGVTAEDEIDGDLGGAVVVGGDVVDPQAEGSYTITYNVSDAAGNAAAEVTRTVIVDGTAPVVTRLGPDPLKLKLGDAFTDPGVTAEDDIDGDLGGAVVVGGAVVDPQVAGIYLVTYNVSDGAGNAAAEVTRTVIIDGTAPVITLAGSNPQVIGVGAGYIEAGASALDDTDGDLSGAIAIDASAVNPAVAGSYPVTYNVSDAVGNAALEVTRTVIVDGTAPVITRLGPDPLKHRLGDAFTDPGVTALDDIDGDLGGAVVVGGAVVDPQVAGSYLVTYNVSDTAGNAAVEVTRTVIVDGTAPVITLLGPAVIKHQLGAAFTDPGVTAEDTVDGDLTAQVVVGGDVVDPQVEGSYTITYNVSDAAGNAATEATRTVIVDGTAPVITLVGPAVLKHQLGAAFTDPGATAEDTVDGDLTAQVVVGGDAVDPQVEGSYTITYNVSDAAGNAAVEVTRTVIVDDARAGDHARGAGGDQAPAGRGVHRSGAIAEDTVDGDLTAQVVVGGDVVDPQVEGSYLVTYNVSDTAGNAAVEVTRTVVVDGTAPVVTLVGSAVIKHQLGDAFNDPGATAEDTIDGDLTAQVVVGGDAVDPQVEGSYLVTYNVSDAAGNAATEVTRTVVVDGTAPVITLLGPAVLKHQLGAAFTDPGATAEDTVDGDLTAQVVVGGDVVDPQVEGSYLVTYNVSDAAGNAAVEVTRTVIVDGTAPVITLVGPAVIKHQLGAAFTDPGATAEDTVDGDLGGAVVVGGAVVDPRSRGSIWSPTTSATGRATRRRRSRAR